MNSDTTSKKMEHCSNPVPIILDTDIGPDCDDAGAVAVLHALARSGEAEIVGMFHCTSSRWGAACLDALNLFYGREDIPVGTLEAAGFLDDDSQYSRYNKWIAVGYPNRFDGKAEAPAAVALYRKLLAQQEDGRVVITAIGPLLNLMNLLQSVSDEASELSGIELVRRKAAKLVVMGGAFPEGKDWNFEMHPEAAAYVMEHWPTPVVLAGSEIGKAMLTGGRLAALEMRRHPVRDAYEWFTSGSGLRESWDLAAVLYAVRGASAYWHEQRGTVRVLRDGGNIWEPDSGGRHAYLTFKASPLEVAETLDELLAAMPESAETAAGSR